MADHVMVRLDISDLDKPFLYIQRQGTNLFPREYASTIVIRSESGVETASMKYNRWHDAYKIDKDWWPSFSRRENLKARDRVKFDRVPNAAGEYRVTVSRAAPSRLPARVLEIAADVSYLEKKIQQEEGWVDGFWSHLYYSQAQALEEKERKVSERKQRLLALRQEQKFLIVRALCLRSM